MNANFEKLTYNTDMLRNSWKDQLGNFTIFASSNNADKGITDFISWIYKNNYSKNLFAGSSLFTLLINKPKNGKFNYQQTLSISFNDSTRIYEMQYSDWDTIERHEDSDNAILWEAKSNGAELPMKFLEFMNWNKNWN
jgi:hypothetical protein